ncbi:MAG: hypothetical protein NC489_42750 [Ruminococcus flavefaciens]|nr:hypothetical protein [Ruminococcus flavefaciens]
MIHDAIASFLLYVPALFSSLWAMINIKVKSYLQKIILSILCLLGIIIFAGSILINICRLHCILHTTIIENTDQYEVLNIKDINHIYFIAYDENNTIKTTTTNEIYDVCENAKISYDISKKLLIHNTDYVVYLKEYCDSPKIIYEIASLPLISKYSISKENQIRLYTQKHELLNQNDRDYIWYYIGYAFLGLYIVTPTFCIIYEQFTDNNQNAIDK